MSDRGHCKYSAEPKGSGVGVLDEVREHVFRAVGLLRSLGPEWNRRAWLLEDFLMFLDEPEKDWQPGDWDMLESTAIPMEHEEAKGLAK